MILSLATLFAACSPVDYDHFSTITGMIYDVDNNEPVGQVLITLSPGGLSTHSNNEGYFIFKELEAQPYTIIVQKAGYKDTHRNIDVPSGETVNISIFIKKQ